MIPCFSMAPPDRLRLNAFLTITVYSALSQCFSKSGARGSVKGGAFDLGEHAFLFFYFDIVNKAILRCKLVQFLSFFIHLYVNKDTVLCRDALIAIL